MDERREVWRLRRDVTRHPARPLAGGWPGGATSLEHRACVRWASFYLAEALNLGGARRHLTAMGDLLRDGPVGTWFGRFLEAADAGSPPTEAVSEAGAPAAVADLVAAVAQVVACDSDARRMGSFGYGLPCCRTHQAPVLERLAAAHAADDTGKTEAESAAGALLVLRAHLALLDLDLATLRQRAMAVHPSALPSRAGPPLAAVPAAAWPPRTADPSTGATKAGAAPRTQLLPAG